jgi:6-phosphogluconolactonase (cycloisomerase 2 family)
MQPHEPQEHPELAQPDETVPADDAPPSAGPWSTISRRVLLAGAAAAAAIGSVSAFAKTEDAADPPSRGDVLAYIGTYTPNGQGIHVRRVDPTTGNLIRVTEFLSGVNPSWIAFNPAKTFLYTANEIDNFNGTKAGSVSAYAVNRANGDLTLLNTVSSQGAGPAHLSVDPSGKWVLVANYGEGNVAVLPVQGDGSLSNATDVKNDADACGATKCAVGPKHAQKANAWSYANSGHDAPHAHMIATDPGGNFAIVNDLGLDLTIVWNFDRVNGKLSNPRTVPSSPGAGPRHFAFHPNGRWFYRLNEESSTLDFLTYDPGTGTLTPVQEVSTLPPNFVGTDYTSEVMVSADGRYVYAANRLHDTIATFAIGGTGRVTRLGEEWTRGDYPRSFGIEPSGRFMYVCNHRGDSVTVFRLLGGGRSLRFTELYVPVGSPAVITFLQI